jgi:hypothetical protein
VGTKPANNPTKSLFIYPGYLKVVVDAAITVATNEFVYDTVGIGIFNLSTAILFNAVLSNTTTASALQANLFNVSKLLYGYTTTSLVSKWLGNTEYVWIIFLGNLSFKRSNKYEPVPLPVPPAIEWINKNPFFFIIFIIIIDIIYF